jgi:hypothetical protein
MELLIYCEGLMNTYALWKGYDHLAAAQWTERRRGPEKKALYSCI